MIVEDTSLSNVQRMHYLCSCLKGEVSAAMVYLAITADNFTVAWKLLSSRYENKRQLISFHLNSLSNLLALGSETSKELQSLRDKTNVAIETLRNLSRPVDHWSDILVFIVSQKLDKSSRKAWELKLGDNLEYPTYDELNNFIESHIRALEAILPIAAKSEKNHENSTKSQKQKKIAPRVRRNSCV